MLYHGPIATGMIVLREQFFSYTKGVMEQNPITYDPLGLQGSPSNAADDVLVIPSEGNVEFV